MYEPPCLWTTPWRDGEHPLGLTLWTRLWINSLPIHPQAVHTRSPCE